MAIDDLIAKHGAQLVIDALSPWVTETRKDRIDDVLNSRLTTLTAVFENLHDPHNGAAAVRSLEAFGMSELHAVETNEPFRTHKGVSIGGQQWLTMHRFSELEPCASQLRERGFALCATLPDATATLDDLDWSRPRAFWFGNEHDGLSNAAIEVCDESVTIPMHGFTRSLNLSVSAALIMSRAAELRRQAVGARGDMADHEKMHLRARWLSFGVRGAEPLIARHVSESTQSVRGDADTML